MEKLPETYRTEGLEDLTKELHKECQNLQADFHLIGFTYNDLLEIEISGDDSNLLCKILEKKWALAPLNLENIHVKNILKGFVINTLSNNNGLTLDIGIRIPHSVPTLYPKTSILYQLGDAQNISITEIVKHFCLIPDRPLEVTVTEITDDGVFVELSHNQVENLWILDSTPLPKMIVTGCPPSKIQKIMQNPKLNRYIIKSEPLGLTAHLLYCRIIKIDRIRAKFEDRLGCSICSFKPSLRRQQDRY